MEMELNSVTEVRDTHDRTGDPEAVIEVESMMDLANPDKPMLYDPTIDDYYRTHPCPVHVFQGFIKDFLDTYGHLPDGSYRCEIPDPYWVFLMSTYLGNLFCKRIRIRGMTQSHLVYHPEPRLFLINIGQSGVQKKSTANNLVNDFFHEFGLQYPNKETIHVCQPASDRGLIDALNEHKISVFVADELYTLTQKAKIQSSALLPIINELFEKTTHHHQIKGEVNNLYDVHLSFIANTTDEMWEDQFSVDFQKIGLLNRLWICPSNEKIKVPWPEEIPEEEVSRLVRALNDIDERWPLPSTSVRLDNEAMALWRLWYNDLDTSEEARRLENYAIKFLQIFCLSENKMIVIEEMLQRVFQLIEWQRQMRIQYAPIITDDKQSKPGMEERIRRVLRNVEFINMSNLQNKVHMERFGLETFSRALSNLEENNEIKIVKEGRKRIVSKI